MRLEERQELTTASIIAMILDIILVEQNVLNVMMVVDIANQHQQAQIVICAIKLLYLIRIIQRQQLLILQPLKMQIELHVTAL